MTDKRATFSCTPGLQRPSPEVAQGLLAAGDYVQGPYPATLEGAVRSGEEAIRLGYGVGLKPGRRVAPVHGCDGFMYRYAVLRFAIQNSVSYAEEIMRMSHKDTSKPTIQVLERSFALLDLLADHPDPVSLKEISERTGLHPSTAHRILNDLTIGRFVDRPRPAATAWACAAGTGQPGQGRLDVREAALGRCASCTR
jgi:hypothetical protein